MAGEDGIGHGGEYALWPRPLGMVPFGVLPIYPLLGILPLLLSGILDLGLLS